MVGILQRPESQGERFMNSFKSAGPQLHDVFVESMKPREGAISKEEVNKNLEGLTGMIPKELKNRGLGHRAEDPVYIDLLKQVSSHFLKKGNSVSSAFDEAIPHANAVMSRVQDLMEKEKMEYNDALQISLAELNNTLKGKKNPEQKLLGEAKNQSGMNPYNLLGSLF